MTIVAVLAAFHLAAQLYKTPIKARNTTLSIFSLMIGTALGLIHVLLTFSTFNKFEPTFSPTMLIAVWFLCIGIAYTVLDASSIHDFTIQALSKAILICTPLIFGTYLADWNANSPYAAFHIHTPELIAASLISMLVVAGNVLIFSWIKTYQGEHQNPIKVVLAGAVTLGIFSTHVAHNQAIHLNTNFTESGREDFTGIIIALVLLVILAAFFIFTLLFEKRQAKLLLGRIQSGDASISEIPLDALTQLPNRKAFDLYLASAFKRNPRENRTFAIAYVDLDHFKPINDNYGHHVGDAALKIIAERLNAAVRNCDFVARIGGDEFTVLFEDISSDEDIIPIAQRIVDSIKEPFWALKHFIEISCSVGIAIHNPDINLKTLMLNADAAMYKAKEGGKNQFKFFDKEIELASNQMHDLHAELQTAIDQHQFSLAFLPRVDCNSLSPVGAEAIIRWQHPERGVLLAKQFMPSAERFGFTSQINDWVLEECCSTLERANQAGIDLRLSVNMSLQQFRNASLADKIIRLLKKYGLRPDQLILAVKDIAATPNKKQITQMLTSFKRAGIRVSMDDFGAQFLSLDSLKSLDISEVKLDRAFIQQIDKDSRTRGMLDAVIRLAHALDLNVVACGVENKAQQEILKELNCNQMQGLLLAEPLSQHRLLHVYDQLYNKYETTGRFTLSDYQAISI